MMLLDLCWSFVQVGLFSIGGGLAAIPLISHQVVDIHGWLTMAELTDLIAIAEATPGPIAVNVATFVGARLGGPIAATLATVSVILPGCIIALGLARLYMRYRSLPLLQGVLDGLRPAVVALIATGGVAVLRAALWGDGPVALSNTDVISAVSFVACFWILLKRNPSPVLLMLGAGVAGCAVRLALG